MAEQDRGSIIRNVVSSMHSADATPQQENEELNLKDTVRRVAVGADHGGYEIKDGTNRRC